MNRKIILSMHWLVLGAFATVLLVFALYHLDPYDYNDGSGQLGFSLGYAFLYFWALVFGFVGWILSIVLLLEERHARTKHSKYALAYVLIGFGGFAWAYYLIQAS